jgi:hypothetical protein
VLLTISKRGWFSIGPERPDMARQKQMSTAKGTNWVKGCKHPPFLGKLNALFILVIHAFIRRAFHLRCASGTCFEELAKITKADVVKQRLL